MWLPVSWLAARLASGTGETFKNVTAGVASISTVLAIIVGAIWAWFKFVRGRTFQPRVSVEMLGQWRPVDGEQADTSSLFHARVRINNIGAAKVTLKQYGTGPVRQLSRRTATVRAAFTSLAELLRQAIIFRRAGRIPSIRRGGVD
jgi:hypothetical protein